VGIGNYITDSSLDFGETQKNKNMKYKKIMVAFAILSLSSAVLFACQTITQLGKCSGVSSQPAKCANGCVSITYDPSAQMICTLLPENACGASDCSSKCVTCVQIIDVETSQTFGGLCIGCGLPDYQEYHSAGTCNQDYIPPSAVTCGSCP